MRHRRQHSGWSTQARRRGEQFVMCLTCGQRQHPRPFQQATPAPQPETIVDFFKALAVMALLVVAFVTWLSIAAASQVPA